MECLIHSPAFNCVKMAWVAGVGPHKGPPLEERRLEISTELVDCTVPAKYEDLVHTLGKCLGGCRTFREASELFRAY